MNGSGDEGKDWTWECTFKFIKQNSVSEDLEQTDKNKIYATNQGLLWKISQTNNKNEKKKVIDFCAKHRGSKVNRILDSETSLSNLSNRNSGLENDKIKTTKEFKLEKTTRIN